MWGAHSHIGQLAQSHAISDLLSHPVPFCPREIGFVLQPAYRLFRSAARTSLSFNPK